MEAQKAMATHGALVSSDNEDGDSVFLNQLANKRKTA